MKFIIYRITELFYETILLFDRSTLMQNVVQCKYFLSQLRFFI